MNSLTGLIYALTFLYIVSGDAHVYMPSSIDDGGDGQISGQSDDPENTAINQDDQAPAATQPAVITTSLAGSGDGEIPPFTQKPFAAKLLSKSNHIDHKEDKDRRSFIISNIEAYKLPENNLLIRSRFIGAIDWIIHKPNFEGKNLPFYKPVSSANNGKSANHLKLLLRNKRQADSYGMPNPMNNGQGGPMRPGDQPMRTNPVDGIRQFFGRLREIMNDIRRAFSGNRVDTNMQGMGNMPGTDDMQNLPNVPK